MFVIHSHTRNTITEAERAVGLVVGREVRDVEARTAAETTIHSSTASRPPGVTQWNPGCLTLGAA